MRTTIFILICITLSFTANAQKRLMIHQKNKIVLGASLSSSDSIYFSNGQNASFCIGGKTETLPISAIDSLSFSDQANVVSISWNGESVSVVNPFAFEGVKVEANGGNILVNSSIDGQEIDYQLNGNTTNGQLKIYSESKFNLILNGLSLTNQSGPAINIQSGKKCSLKLNAGTNNFLTDGAIYSESQEDQKATLFSEGKLSISGTGTLTVKSNLKHAICSDDFVSIDEGTVVVAGAAKDGIHANDYFQMNGGTLKITATGDGIDSEGCINIAGGSIEVTSVSENVNGIKADSTLNVTGGTIAINISGNQSKGLKSDQQMSLTGGSLTISNSGGVILEASGSGFNPAYCAAIKCDGNITVDGANITIRSTGTAGRGISGKADINLNSGTVDISTTGGGATYKNTTGVTDAYNAACISADGNITVGLATLTVSSSGSAGKGITGDGKLTIGSADKSPNVTITTTGSKVTISAGSGGGGPGGGGSSGTYAEAKAITCAGAVTLENGTVNISSADDGIKSTNSVTVNNGKLTISKAVEGIESPLIVVNNGEVSVSTTDDGINATYSTVKGGTESNDGSYLKVNGGTLSSTTTTGDAIDSNGNILVSGGMVVANGPASGVEESCDFNGTFTMNGGTFIGAGSNSNMTKAMSASSGQVNLLIKSSAMISSSSLIHLQTANGSEVLTFKPQNGGYYFLASSPLLTKGASCSIYTGGSYTGGTAAKGFYSGGTYAGGTLKKTVTLSSSTTVNTVSF